MTNDFWNSGPVGRTSAPLLVLGFVCGFSSVLLAAESTPPSTPVTANSSTNRLATTRPLLSAEAQLAIVFDDWDHLIDDWEASWDDVGPGLVSYIEETRIILLAELERIRRGRQAELAGLRSDLLRLREALSGERVSARPAEAQMVQALSSRTITDKVINVIPEEQMWRLSGELREFVGYWIDRQKDSGIDLMHYLREPVKLLNEETKRVDQEARRAISELQAEIAALQSIAKPETRSSTNAANPSALSFPVISPDPAGR